MNRKIVSSEHAPVPVGPYSQAVVIGSMVYVSGQIPLCPVRGTVVSGEVGEQTRQVLRNLAAVLSSAGSSMEKVVKTTLFLKNMDDFAEVNTVYAEFFPADPPARSTVEVARLPKDVRIEIEAIACM